MALRNMTITVDHETARWARLEAARRELSVSRLVGELLRREMSRTGDYAAAMDRWVNRDPYVPDGPPVPYPSREEVHDRAGLRRLERDRLRQGPQGSI